MPLDDDRAGARDALRVDVDHDDRQAGDDACLGDAGAHGSGADDADALWGFHAAYVNARRRRELSANRLPCVRIRSTAPHCNDNANETFR